MLSAATTGSMRFSKGATRECDFCKSTRISLRPPSLSQPRRAIQGPHIQCSGISFQRSQGRGNKSIQGSGNNHTLSYFLETSLLKTKISGPYRLYYQLWCAYTVPISIMLLLIRVVASAGIKKMATDRAKRRN